MIFLWTHRRKGAGRQRVALPVRVIGHTPAGGVVIQYERRGRVVRKIVAAKNVEVAAE